MRICRHLHDLQGRHDRVSHIAVQNTFTQEERPPDFPLNIEFADSLAGKSSIALLNVCHPSKNDIANIKLSSEIFENLTLFNQRPEPGQTLNSQFYNILAEILKTNDI